MRPACYGAPKCRSVISRTLAGFTIKALSRDISRWRQASVRQSTVNFWRGRETIFTFFRVIDTATNWPVSSSLLRHLASKIKCRPSVGEGSRPRDPWFSKPSTFRKCRRKYTLGWGTFSRRAGTRALPELHPRRGWRCFQRPDS